MVEDDRYWISHTPMSPDDWRPYPDGLKALLLREGIKCDTGLTTDIARILRVPGTLNHKYDPPRPAELLHFGHLYDFPAALAVLRGVAPSNSVTARASAPAVPVIEPGHEGDFAGGPDPAFTALYGADDLAKGIITRRSVPLDPAPVFQKCGFMRQPGTRAELITTMLSGCTPYSAPHSWRMETPSHTRFRRGIPPTARLKPKKCTSASSPNALEALPTPTCPRLPQKYSFVPLAIIRYGLGPNGQPSFSPSIVIRLGSVTYRWTIVITASFYGYHFPPEPDTMVIESCWILSD